MHQRLSYSSKMQWSDADWEDDPPGNWHFGGFYNLILKDENFFPLAWSYFLFSYLVCQEGSGNIYFPSYVGILLYNLCLVCTRAEDNCSSKKQKQSSLYLRNIFEYWQLFTIKGNADLREAVIFISSYS